MWEQLEAGAAPGFGVIRLCGGIVPAGWTFEGGIRNHACEGRVDIWVFGMRLLLVDDEQNILTGMRRYFCAQGYDVDCAADREAAHALARHVVYDAVVIDPYPIVGQGPDGGDVIRWIRERSPATRIVVLSAFGSPDTVREAMRLGANSYLQKPCFLRDVHQEVKRLLHQGTAS